MPDESTTLAGRHDVWVVIPSNSHHSSAHAVILDSLNADLALEVTLVIHKALEPLTRSYFAKHASALLPRLSITSYGSPDLTNEVQNWGILLKEGMKLVVPALQTVVGPSRFILSMFNANFLTPVVRAKWPQAGVWMHWSSCAGWLYNLLRPSPDGAGDYQQIIAKVKGERALSEQEMMGLVAKVIFAGNGITEVDEHVVELPGLSSMYNYELHAENAPTPPPLALMLRGSIDGARLVDGITINTSLLLENEMCRALGEYCKIQPLGLQTDHRAWKGTAKLEEGQVKEFLDKQDPEKGVLFISFGTAYFPQTYLKEFVDALLESDQPFLLVSRSPRDLPGDLTVKLSSAPHGLYHPSFLDQVAVLSHPATKWFMTQGGWISISESLVLGVPLIVWPLGNNDQAYNAALLSTRQEPLGIELLQVRTGKAARKTMRGVEVKGTPEAAKWEMKEVLSKLGSKEVEHIKDNVREMAKLLREEHGGSAEVLKTWEMAKA